MHPAIVALIITGYFLALLIISHFVTKGANNSTFFTGNRKMPWPLVAIAMITAPITGVTFISVPGMVLTKGYGYLQMCLGFVVGYFIIAWVLIPIFYRHNVISIYSFLEQRFGSSTYKTGAWMFLISKMLGIAVRFLVVCASLQMLVFGPFHLPFIVNVLVTMFLIWLYTVKGGVKTVVWADTFKSFCLVASLILCVYFIASHLDISINDLWAQIKNHPSTRMFFFDNPSESSYFWKQFIGGIFLVVAMTGLDQDMMQCTLACRDPRSSQKNLAVSGVMQFVVISLILILGTMLLLYMEKHSVAVPAKTDDIFATVAFHHSMPLIVGVLFVVGLISASYSSVGSALTSLTTSYTIDIMQAPKKHDELKVGKIRRRVHITMTLIMALIIVAFYYLNNQDAISAVFTLASYTYGPILGLFVFGLFTHKQVDGRRVTVVCLSSPFLAYATAWLLRYLFGYETGFELLLINAFITLLGLMASTSRRKSLSYDSAE